MRIFSILRRCLGTAFNPQIGRSLQPFATTYRSFGHLLVQVFGALKLIERTHPWMRPTARVRPLEVLAFAWARTDWRKPWQPVPVFVASISALLFFAVTSFSGMALLGATKASNAYAASMFTSPSEKTDLALKYMSDAFGVKVGTDVPKAVTDGVVEGFQQVMGLYSMAMLVIAGFILLYIILAAIAATAHEGRFGGGSFNQIWAPIRLVVAIGLLVPLPMNGFAGYNSGQYIVLKLSEFGSGLATNLWIPFAKALMAKQDVMAMPNVEPAASVVRGVLLAEFCAARYNKVNEEILGGTQPAVGRNTITSGDTYLVYYSTKVSSTNQYCGVSQYEKSHVVQGMAKSVLDGYEKAYVKMRGKAEALAATLNDEKLIGIQSNLPGTGNEDAIWENLIGPKGGAEGFVKIVTDYQDELAQAVNGTQPTQKDSAKDALTEEVENAGWAGAAMWFNTIARMNAEFMAAVRAMPMTAPPDLKKASDASGLDADILDLKISKGIMVLNSYLDGIPARLPDFGYSTDSTAGSSSVGDVQTSSVVAGLGPQGPGNISATIGGILSYVFSTEFGGPFGHIGVGADAHLAEINPMADLAAIGDWIVNKSLALLGVAVGGGLASGITADMGPIVKSLGQVTATMSSMLFTIAAIGFGTGVMLSYVLPLLPFIRFLFGVVGWLLNILEAVIAIPLIAVAHLTAKGEGISGDAARTAYYMIFSVFLRPALLIVGMMVALMMFSVAISVLNDMYKSAVLGFHGTAPGDAAGGLSVVIYTVMYAVIAYMLCNLCFKLIEEIPNHAMKWINAQSAGREISQDEQVAKAISSAGDHIVYSPLSSIGGRIGSVGR